MKKNFLTTGVVMALAWISLAPISLLFIATIASGSYAIQVKIAALLATLFSWIFLSMETGFLWQKESRRQIPSPHTKKNGQDPTPVTKTLRLGSLQAMKEEDFSRLCIRIFEKLWPEMTIDKASSESPNVQDWMVLLHQKLYLVHCENRKTFFDSREILLFKQKLQEKGATRGYFFTTGVFSIPAQDTARSAKIELIDGQKTVELLESFLSDKDLLPYDEQSLERRRHPRLSYDDIPFKHRPSMELGNVYQRAPKTKVGILNISRGGVCIESSFTEELPSFFRLSLKLPTYPVSLHILGEVVWCHFQQPNQTKRYGISFVSMTDKNREKLNLFLNDSGLARPTGLVKSCPH